MHDLLRFRFLLFNELVGYWGGRFATGSNYGLSMRVSFACTVLIVFGPHEMKSMHYVLIHWLACQALIPGASSVLSCIIILSPNPVITISYINCSWCTLPLSNMHLLKRLGSVPVDQLDTNDHLRRVQKFLGTHLS